MRLPRAGASRLPGTRQGHGVGRGERTGSGEGDGVPWTRVSVKKRGLRTSKGAGRIHGVARLKVAETSIEPRPVATPFWRSPLGPRECRCHRRRGRPPSVLRGAKRAGSGGAPSDPGARGGRGRLLNLLSPADVAGGRAAGPDTSRVVGVRLGVRESRRSSLGPGSRRPPGSARRRGREEAGLRPWARAGCRDPSQPAGGRGGLLVVGPERL